MAEANHYGAGLESQGFEPVKVDRILANGDTIKPARCC
jgi:hypothetical protein